MSGAFSSKIFFSCLYLVLVVAVVLLLLLLKFWLLVGLLFLLALSVFDEAFFQITRSYRKPYMYL